MRDTQKVPILGVGIDPINMSLATETIARWVKKREPNYICVAPAHSVMDGYNDPQFKEILNRSGLTTPDGMAIVWILRALGHQKVRRVYGPDLMQAVCGLSVEYGWRHFFYGGAPGIGEKLAERLSTKYPGLRVVGVYSPPFRPLTEAEDSAIIEQINQSNADILWVGISSPKQEAWMRDHLNKIDAPVMIGVGAAFDFLSGNKKQAPRWMQHGGLEWIFRLIQEPKRLWPRYRQYPLFLILVISQLLGIRKFPYDSPDYMNGS